MWNLYKTLGINSNTFIYSPHKHPLHFHNQNLLKEQVMGEASPSLAPGHWPPSVRLVPHHSDREAPVPGGHGAHPGTPPSSRPQWLPTAAPPLSGGFRFRQLSTAALHSTAHREPSFLSAHPPQPPNVQHHWLVFRENFFHLHEYSFYYKQVSKIKIWGKISSRYPDKTASKIGCSQYVHIWRTSVTHSINLAIATKAEAGGK